MGRAPHEVIHEKARWPEEDRAKRVVLEAKYGVPYEKLPEILWYPPPEHPKHRNARRQNYCIGRSYRYGDLLGWRAHRTWYLERVEKFRQAEIAVRKLRTKRTGRGKPLDRKAHVHARERIDAREWRDEL